MEDDDAVMMMMTDKALRTRAFLDAHKGKTRRRKIDYFVRDFEGNELERVTAPNANLAPSSYRPTLTKYELTEIDLHPAKFSLKAKPENLRQALFQLASSTTIDASASSIRIHRDPRKWEVFDLEITKEMITAPGEYRQETTRSEDGELTHVNDEYRVGTLYRLRFKPKLGVYLAADLAKLHYMVRALPKRDPVLVRAGEEVLYGKPSFLSSRTSPLPNSRLRDATRGPMVDDKREQREIAHYVKHSWMLEEQVFYGWASESPMFSAGEEFEHWFLEFDFKQTVLPTAIVIQGKPPALRTFPRVHHFTCKEEYSRYRGPIWPIIDLNSGTGGQWVELFKVHVRQERGKWMDLGPVFKGNWDPLTQVRVDLPVKMSACRYMRIQPLSRVKGGFHGDYPAMRCNLLGRIDMKQQQQQGTGNGLREDGHLPALEDGFVRYILKTTTQSPPRATAALEEQEATQSKRQGKFASGAAARIFCRSWCKDDYRCEQRIHRKHYHDAIIKESL